jgi:hypothetical protein
MILDSYPPARARPGLHFLGFWFSEYEPELPSPWDYVDGTWDHAERMRVVDYLKAAPEVEWWRGYSTCRFCGDPRNGTTDRSDGVYLWPDGFAHYVERHGVRPPELFVAHVRRALVSAPGKR